MKASSKLTQASRMGWELGGKATSVGWNPGAPSVGSRVAGNVLILHHTLQSPGSIPRGRDAVNQCWAWGTGISCAACMKLVEMKSQKPATNEKWEAWDVMLKGRNYQLWESVEIFMGGRKHDLAPPLRSCSGGQNWWESKETREHIYRLLLLTWGQGVTGASSRAKAQNKRVFWDESAKLSGKDPDTEGRRRRGWQDEMVGWQHQLNGHEFE